MYPTSGPVLAVPTWTGPGTIDPAALHGGRPLVFCIATPDTVIRDTARGLVRDALRDVLGTLLGLPAARVPLLSRPGHPIRLDLPDTRIRISVSHEPGLSLTAIHPDKAIGVDLMRVPQKLDWMNDWAPVARDYLGPRAAADIARLPPAEHARAFARAWTRLEASLKCHDLQLQEWSPATELAMARCSLHDLALPDSFIGTLALRTD